MCAEVEPQARRCTKLKRLRQSPAASISLFTSAPVMVHSASFIRLTVCNASVYSISAAGNLPAQGFFCGDGLLAGAAGCKKAGPPPPPPPPEVQVVTVALQDVPVYQEWIGSWMDRHAQIRAQVSGYLLSQEYKEGSLVKKGDVLFRIDPRTFEAALNQAKGQLGMAEAQMGRTDWMSNASLRWPRQRHQPGGTG